MAKLRRTQTGMTSYLRTLSAFFRLPFAVQWRTFLVQLPRYVPLFILHLTSPKGPHPFVVAVPSRGSHSIPIYIFVPPSPDSSSNGSPLKVPVHLDFHGGGFIMGSPLEQAPFCALLSRTLGAVVISVSYRLGPLHQFPAAIHDAEDVLAAVLDSDGVTEGGRVLRAELQNHYTVLLQSGRRGQQRESSAAAPGSIELDPTHLSISGFSAGGNLALNLALSIPASSSSPPDSPSSVSAEPLLSLPSSTSSVVPDASAPWPSLLPFPTAHPTLIPLLLFYPSLDARLLPHKRPLPPSMSQKPRVPGLFSVMGPTYLPNRLRAHPRASPGLANPQHALHRNVSIFLVLPEYDSLAVQSQEWVGKMNEAGWSGPVRKGDEDEGVSDGAEDRGADGVAEGMNGGRNGGLEVWHAPGCRHGWTQFPESWLGKHEKAERKKVFARTMDFVREAWGVEV